MRCAGAHDEVATDGLVEGAQATEQERSTVTTRGTPESGVEAEQGHNLAVPARGADRRGQGRIVRQAKIPAEPHH